MSPQLGLSHVILGAQDGRSFKGLCEVERDITKSIDTLYTFQHNGFVQRNAYGLAPHHSKHKTPSPGLDHHCLRLLHCLKSTRDQVPGRHHVEVVGVRLRRPSSRLPLALMEAPLSGLRHTGIPAQLRLDLGSIKLATKAARDWPRLRKLLGENWTVGAF